MGTIKVRKIGLINFRRVMMGQRIILIYITTTTNNNKMRDSGIKTGNNNNSKNNNNQERETAPDNSGSTRMKPKSINQLLLCD